MEFNIETISAIALGIGLSASSGFRVFVPLLIAGLAAHFGFLPLGDNFVWMSSIPALLCFGAAAVIEVLAYYIPFVDNLLDTISTPLALMAGTLLMTSVFPSDSEWIRWIMGFIVGGGSATTIQTGSSLTRLLSSKFTAGIGNPIVSTGEGVAATGFSILALFIPIIIATILILFIVLYIRVIYRRIRKKRKSDIKVGTV